ncbi:MAG: cobalamin biosynthesis protein CobW [Rhizobiales bacterium]|nr:cobalamin biosynthesis protein CobW [Hyphomicrobiales bacterium]
MARTQKIPATIFTGFLGAGKTTVIRQLLEQANGRRIALIINEFGDVGVDGDVLAGCGDQVCTRDDIIELANGCICCTVADDFLPSMTALLDRPNPPDHIIIETSGLALPQPLVKAFSWPTIRERVSVDGVITIVDTAAVAEGRFAANEAAVETQRSADPSLDHESPLHELFEDQLACADMILLNKADLVDEATLQRVEDDLRLEVRAGVTFLATRQGAINGASLLGLGAKAEEDMANRLSHHEAEHGHEEHDHDDFESFVVEAGPFADRNAVLSVVEKVMRDHDVLRLKGFVALTGAASRLVVQAVGPRVDAYFDRPWRAEEVRRSALVVISQKGIDAAAIRNTLQAALTA